MPAKQELERRGLTELAVLCQKVAANPSTYSTAAADEALGVTATSIYGHYRQYGRAGVR